METFAYGRWLLDLIYFYDELCTPFYDGMEMVAFYIRDWIGLMFSRLGLVDEAVGGVFRERAFVFLEITKASLCS